MERPEEYLKELNPLPPVNPPKSITFKTLNRRVPQFMQSNPHSFHACFYRPGESPLPTSSRFHPREDEDVETSLPWCVPLEDDTQIETTAEASRREYINQNKEDQAEIQTMRHCGLRRRMLYEESTQRRSSFPHRGRGVRIAPSDSYD